MGGSDPLPGDDPRDEAPAGITDDARRDDTTAKTDSTVEASDGSEEEHSNRGLAEVDSTDAVASVSGSDDDSIKVPPAALPPRSRVPGPRRGACRCE